MTTQDLSTPSTLYKYLNVSRMHSFLEKPGISLSSVCLFEDKQEGICQPHILRAQTKKVLRDAYEKSPYGVLCLCEKPANFCMWKKYAEDHRGTMIGFNSAHAFFTQDPLESTWNKVNYTDNVPTLPMWLGFGSPPQEYKEKVIKILKESILRKDKKWQFEAEWRKRGVLEKAGTWRSFHFPQRGIGSIVRFMCMGAKVSIEDKSLCEAFCQCHQIPLYQATLSGDSVSISGL